jgi:hypothetical protein
MLTNQVGYILPIAILSQLTDRFGQGIGQDVLRQRVGGNGSYVEMTASLDPPRVAIVGVAKNVPNGSCADQDFQKIRDL